VARTGPRRKEEEKARVGLSRDLVALVWGEVDEDSGPRLNRLAVLARDDQLSPDEEDPSTLMHLMVLKDLPGGEVEADRTPLIRRGEDIWTMRFPIP
jgi:hypothetical protein